MMINGGSLVFRCDLWPCCSVDQVDCESIWPRRKLCSLVSI